MPSKITIIIMIIVCPDKKGKPRGALVVRTPQLRNAFFKNIFIHRNK